MKRLLCWYIRREADRIDAAFPGPYPDESYGATHKRFASLLRHLAEKMS